MKEFSTDVNLNSNVLNTLHEEISVVDDEESSEVPLQAGEVIINNCFEVFSTLKSL